MKLNEIIYIFVALLALSAVLLILIFHIAISAHKEENEEITLREATILNRIGKKYNDTQWIAVKKDGIIHMYHECDPIKWKEWFMSLNESESERGIYFVKSVKIEQVEGVPIISYWIMEE